MRFGPSIMSSVAALAITCVAAAAYYYKSRKVEVNEVMVFCKLQYNAFNSFDKLMSFVESAKESIDVCMPGLHNPAIHARLVNAVLKKIKLRIIIDRNSYRHSTEFFLTELIEAGAEIKCRKNNYNEQPKFCIIDGKMLLSGTLNWGDDRSSDGWNYVYVTNKNELVEPVVKEFQPMWDTAVSLEDALERSLTLDESQHCEPQEVLDEAVNETFEITIPPSDIVDHGHDSQPVVNGNTDAIELRTNLQGNSMTPQICIH